MMVRHEKNAHLNKKKKPKETQDVRGKPYRRDEKPRFEQECNVLALFRLYYM